MAAIVANDGAAGAGVVAGATGGAAAVAAGAASAVGTAAGAASVSATATSDLRALLETRATSPRRCAMQAGVP